MNTIITLLKPRILSLKNYGRSGDNQGSLKFFILGGLGLLFWAGIFVISLKSLKYFKGIEEIGDILAFKLLSMLIITALALLIFSSILTCLSKLYLSRDLFLVHSLPVPAYQIFTARWIDAAMDAAWMVMIYSLPVLIAYGVIYQAGIFYMAVMTINLAGLAVISASLSAMIVLMAVMVIPANRMKTIFIFIGLVIFILLYFAFRMLKPEQLVDPEAFASVLFYIQALETPSPPYLPSTWMFDALHAALLGNWSSALLHTATLVSCAGTLVCSIIFLADAIYFKGISKTQTAAVRLFRTKPRQTRYFGLSKTVRALWAKEIKTFFRDQAQWSQLFLISALIVIYIYNFKVLPIEKSPIKAIYLQNLLGFLNMGLALFVLTAITARFAYPAVSTEGKSFWIIRSAPVSLKRFLRIKFIFYCLPLVLLSEVLIIVTNILLHVTDLIMILSVVTVFMLTPGIVSLGIGLGAAFPDFAAENPTQTVTSFGGILFMIISATLIGAVIMLEAGPVYILFISGIHERNLMLFEWLWITGSFFLVVILCFASLIIPMRYGVKKLS